MIDKATFDSVLVIVNLFSVERIRQSTQGKWFLKYIGFSKEMEFILLFHTVNLNIDSII